jgi:CRP/FNR family transcriptional regulator
MAAFDLRSYIADHFSSWEHLTADEQNALIANSVLTHYSKGAVIQNGENDCKGLLIIKAGTLRTYMLSDTGKEITLYRLSAGELCVLSASCVLSEITFEVHMEAEEDCDIIFISAVFVQSLMERNVYFEAFAYKVATDRFSDVMWAMQQILFMSMDKRLAVFLWDELSKTGDDTLHLTHEQIARDIGSAREVITRMLKYFSSEGIVEPFRGGIRVIDKKKLRSLTV